LLNIECKLLNIDCPLVAEYRLRSPLIGIALDHPVIRDEGGSGGQGM